VPLLIITLLAPESPWWLVRHGHIERAKQSLERLTDKTSVEGFDIDNTIQMMIHTDQVEREVRKRTPFKSLYPGADGTDWKILKAQVGSSYIDCFRGTELRRTEIVCMLWTVQNLCGSAFMSYSTYFLEQAGLPDSDSYDLSMGQYAINTSGTFVVWVLLTMGVSRR
jgi:SP family general alpha glucoside:H+ symporter-like MFS transporter